MNKHEGGPKSVDLTAEKERDYRKIFNDEFFREDQTEKDPLKLVDQLERSNQLSTEEAQKLREELAQKIEAVDKPLAMLPGSQEGWVAPDSRRENEAQKTLDKLIDMYLKEGWELKVVTDRDEIATVTGREGDIISIELDGFNNQVVRVKLDSLRTLEAWRRGKANEEDQKEKNKQRQEELESRKEEIVDKAIEFYVLNSKTEKLPFEGAPFPYYFRVKGEKVEPILRRGDQVTVSQIVGFPGKERQTVVSLGEITIEDAPYIINM